MQSPSILISVSRQTLTLSNPEIEEREFPISTSRYGLGTEPGSFRTPLGQFEIAEKIGQDAPLGTIFKARVSTGKIGDPASLDDLIQTRILWLHGLQPDNSNTYSRYIYIHGTNHEQHLGTPVSHGCIRMGNADIAEVFEFVNEGTPVEIQP